MAEMDHFRTRRLQDAAHDVDGGVVSVEQRSRRDEPDFMRRWGHETRLKALFRKDTGFT
jgi:hypothetical protein